MIIFRLPVPIACIWSSCQPQFWTILPAAHSLPWKWCFLPSKWQWWQMTELPGSNDKNRGCCSCEVQHISTATGLRMSGKRLVCGVLMKQWHSWMLASSSKPLQNQIGALAIWGLWQWWQEEAGNHVANLEGGHLRNTISWKGLFS